jgi:hypothetical protein
LILPIVGLTLEQWYRPHACFNSAKFINTRDTGGWVVSLVYIIKIASLVLFVMGRLPPVRQKFMDFVDWPGIDFGT